MKRRIAFGCLLLCLSVPVQAQKLSGQQLSGRGAFVFNSVVKAAGLTVKVCPGKLGNPATRCAVAQADNRTIQKKLVAWKGWKQTDPWKGGSTGFTSSGSDQYIVTVMPRIDTGKGTLLIFSEF